MILEAGYRCQAQSDALIPPAKEIEMENVAQSDIMTLNADPPDSNQSKKVR